MSVLGECQPRQVVCDAQALLAAHDAKSVSLVDLILLDASVDPRWEQALAGLGREDCVAADV